MHPYLARVNAIIYIKERAGKYARRPKYIHHPLPILPSRSSPVSKNLPNLWPHICARVVFSYCSIRMLESRHGMLCLAIQNEHWFLISRWNMLSGPPETFIVPIGTYYTSVSHVSHIFLLPQVCEGTFKVHPSNTSYIQYILLMLVDPGGSKIREIRRGSASKALARIDDLSAHLSHHQTRCFDPQSSLQTYA